MKRAAAALCGGALILSACSAGKGSFRAPPPTPTYLSGTPGTVATVPAGGQGGSSSAAPEAPVIAAGTPIPLSTVGQVAPHSPLSTPQALAPPSANTPLPAGCGAVAPSGTPLPGGAVPAVTPVPSPYGPILGQPAPGPYRDTGQVTIRGSLAVPVGAYDASFVPNTIFAQPGQKVTLDIKNGAGITHDFCAPSLGIDNPILIQRPRVPEDVLTAVVVFTAPSQPGVYMFWSNTEGQAQRGMTGVVVVQPGS
jgi:uncharacterized cupredoxin-like copper-binding protein